MMRYSSLVPCWVHRSVTLASLRWMLRTQNRQQRYVPLPGRLLYVAASSLPYHVSGYTTRTHEILLALKQAGVVVRILTRPGYPWDRRDSLATPESLVTAIDGLLYAHERHPSNRRFTALFAAQAADVIAAHAVQHRAAVIHAASNHVNALPALIAARRLGIPFHYEMRGLWELSRASRQPTFENSYNFNLGLELEGLVAQSANRVFVISEALGRFAQTRWGLAAEKLSLLPNCVDIQRIRPDEVTTVMPDSIAYAGSLIAYEGLDTLILAVQKLVEQERWRGRLRLDIMGDGEERPALEALSERLGLQGQVHFHGRLSPDAARARTSQSALVCIPRKPFQVCEVVPPIKLVEAMALGKPVVVPDLPVFRDELGAVPGGWLFRAGDAEHLAEVLGQALANPGELLARGQRGRQMAVERRQWCAFVGDLQTTLERGAPC